MNIRMLLISILLLGMAVITMSQSSAPCLPNTQLPNLLQSRNAIK